jgi:hypothetical protein
MILYIGRLTENEGKENRKKRKELKDRKKV